MTNNEKFNELLNSCENKQDIVEVLLELAANGFFEKRERHG